MDSEIFNLKFQLLRLRDEIESAREALKNEDPEAREQAIGKCSSFLLKESEKIVALQVKSSYKFKLYIFSDSRKSLKYLL